MENKKTYSNIDEYINGFDEPQYSKLIEIRSIIQNAAPDATEVISYNMPALKMNKVLVYFAAYKNHIGFYPTGRGIAAFESELTKYTFSKGAIQFPINKKLPVKLIQRIVKFRIADDALTQKKKK